MVPALGPTQSPLGFEMRKWGAPLGLGETPGGKPFGPWKKERFWEKGNPKRNPKKENFVEMFVGFVP